MLAAGGAAGAFPILSALIFVPILGAFCVLLTKRSRPEFAKLIALITSVATAAMSIWLLASFETGDDGFQFVSQHTWIEQWGIGWHLGVDGISLFMVVLTGLLFPIVIAGIDPHHDEKPYLAWMLMLQAGVMGSFLSLDLFLFFIFFEIVLVPMYFLIGGWGYEGREYAATKFFLYTMLGSAFMLVGLITTAWIASDDLGRVTFDLVEIDQRVFLADAILNGIQPFARHVRCSAMGQMPACGQRHTENRITGLQQRKIHRPVRLRTRMGLNVRKSTSEELFCAINCQFFRNIHEFTATVISAPRIAFGIFVGQHRTRCFEHRLGNDIFRGNQLDLILLAGKLSADRLVQFRVRLPEGGTEEPAMRHFCCIFRRHFVAIAPVYARRTPAVTRV